MKRSFNTASRLTRVYPAGSVFGILRWEPCGSHSLLDENTST